MQKRSWLGQQILQKMVQIVFLMWVAGLGYRHTKSADTMLFVPCSRFRSTHPTENEQLHPRRICSNGLSFGTRGFLSIPVSPDKWGAGRKTIGAFARVTYDRFDGIPCLEYCTQVCPSRANYVLHKHILHGIHVALFGLELIWNCEFRAPTTKRINACFVCKDQLLKAPKCSGTFKTAAKILLFLEICKRVSLKIVFCVVEHVL